VADILSLRTRVTPWMRIGRSFACFFWSLPDECTHMRWLSYRKFSPALVSPIVFVLVVSHASTVKAQGGLRIGVGIGPSVRETGGLPTAQRVGGDLQISAGTSGASQIKLLAEADLSVFGGQTDIQLLGPPTSTRLGYTAVVSQNAAFEIRRYQKAYEAGMYTGARAGATWLHPVNYAAKWVGSVGVTLGYAREMSAARRVYCEVQPTHFLGATRPPNWHIPVRVGLSWRVAS
jgi:hypothetical protein